MLPSSWSRAVPVLSSLAAEDRRGLVMVYARVSRREVGWVLKAGCVYEGAPCAVSMMGWGSSECVGLADMVQKCTDNPVFHCAGRIRALDSDRVPADHKQIGRHGCRVALSRASMPR